VLTNDQERKGQGWRTEAHSGLLFRGHSSYYWPESEAVRLDRLEVGKRRDPSCLTQLQSRERPWRGVEIQIRSQPKESYEHFG